MNGDPASARLDLPDTSRTTPIQACEFHSKMEDEPVMLLKTQYRVSTMVSESVMYMKTNDLSQDATIS